MRLLLIGGSGQLGREIHERWVDADIVAPSHAELDIETGIGVEGALDRARPDLVVNCAAFHNVDVCEDEPGRALAANAVGVDRLARLCRDRDVVFLTISTDYVFSGDLGRAYTETDAPHPISAYGVSKYAGELLVDRLNSRAFVVRTCGVYGRRPSASKGYTFVDRIIRQAKAGEDLRIVSDVIASPTYAGHLAEALRRLVDTSAYGLYHACNGGPVSWFDFAVEALRAAGIDYPVTPISAAEWKAGARRPVFSALANDKLGTLGITLPSWQRGIAAYLQDRVV